MYVITLITESLLEDVFGMSLVVMESTKRCFKLSGLEWIEE